MIDDFGTSRTIRAVRWPQMRQILSSIDPSEAYASHADRKVLRQHHDAVSSYLREWLRPAIDLSPLLHAYHINGIHAGIEYWLASETRPIACLSGEYPYPRHIRGDITIVQEVDHIPRDAVVYMSNPFSANGRYDERYYQISNPMILDIAYIGTTRPGHIKLRDNVEQVLWSPSKAFGTGNLRTGYRFCRTQDRLIEQLYDTGYINILGVRLLNEACRISAVFDNWEYLQQSYQDICDRNGLTPSDTYLMALSHDQAHAHLSREDGTIRLPTGMLLDALIYNQ